MADPISITGLVVGVSQVIFAAAKYAGQVKQADDDIEALLQELLELKGVLVQIQSQPNSTDSTLQGLYGRQHQKTYFELAMSAFRSCLRSFRQNQDLSKARYRSLYGHSRKIAYLNE